MTRLTVWALIIVSVPAACVGAAERPAIAPAAPWVSVTPIPAASDETKSVAVMPLLVDIQSRLTQDGDEQYIETAVRIGSAQGLSAGALALLWDPALDGLTIHRYQLIRDGKSIDLLADGSKLTIVRRETNLERATLDGQLTATFQPEDVRVGDIVDLAYTRLHRDPALGGHSQAVFLVPPGEPFGRIKIRAVWPRSKQVHWRAGPGIFNATESKVGQNRELSADVQSITSARPPRGAPSRFQAVNYVMASDFADWADVSRTMAPLYTKASFLKPGSSLVAEVARIAAISPDPKVRALAALRLVQDQIRYLLLAMDDGGYLPADADLTWSRRFGDCKGKTVLLLALLRELGIVAQPALVATRAGDGLDQRLPMPGAFDHVVVAATIAGKIYWLDGTRPGDRTLDQIKIPNFHWALPLTTTGSGLVALIPEPLTRPQSITTLDLDASAGLDVPATAKGDVTLDGDAAFGLRVALEQLAPDARQRALKEYWHREYDFVTADTVATVDDATTGLFKLTMTGTAKMDWAAYNGRRWYALDGARIGFHIDTARDPGPNKDAPFAVEFPSWTENRQTILLPNGGTGFIVDGPDVDRTIAAFAFHRSIKRDGPRLTMIASTRALAPEIPVVAVEAAKTALAELGARDGSIGAPTNYKATLGDVSTLKATTPVSVDAYLARAGILLDRGDYAGALADADAAIALDGASARAHGLRALALAWKGDARAEASAARAEALDPKLATPWHARSVLAEDHDDHSTAEAMLTRAIGLWPDDTWAFSHRARLRAQRHDYDAALADVDALIKLAPDNDFNERMKGEILVAAGRRTDAISAIAVAVKANPDNIDLKIYQASLLASSDRKIEAAAIVDALVKTHPAEPEVLRARFNYRMHYGDRPGALDDLSALIAIKPDTSSLVDRAQLWPAGDRTHWSTDLDAAMALTPTQLDKAKVFEARAVMEERSGSLAGAQAALDAAGRIDPTDRLLPILLANLLMRQGHYAEAVAALEARAKVGPVDASVMNSLCWTKATRNIKFDTALADCDAALKVTPDNAAFLDSRGFARMKAGQFDGAIADYDAALKTRPTQAASLYGRGLAKIRSGKDGADDVAAARKADPKIEAEFSSYGITAPHTPS